MPNSDFHNQLLAEAQASPSGVRTDSDGNKVWTQPTRRNGPNTEIGADVAMNEPTRALDRRDPIENALAAAVLDDDPYAFSEDGEAIEPDHPDSILRKAGLI